MEKEKVPVWALGVMIILAIMVIAVSFLYLNEKNSVDAKINNSTEENIVYPINNLSQPDQFYSSDKLHFTHLPITYSSSKTCVGPIIQRIDLAFEIITNNTDSIVYFKKVETNADINFVCYPFQNMKAIDLYTTEYTSGQAEPSFSQKIINKTLIKFWSIRNDSMPPSCYTFPRLTIHEILHGLGLAHISYNPYSVMYPEIGGECIKEDNLTTTIISTGETFTPKNKIDDKIVSCLKFIYSMGEVGYCSGVDFLDEESDCEGGWFITDDGEYCCPEPNMTINSEGVCDYI